MKHFLKNEKREGTISNQFHFGVPFSAATMPSCNSSECTRMADDVRSFWRNASTAWASWSGFPMEKTPRDLLPQHHTVAYSFIFLQIGLDAKYYILPLEDLNCGKWRWIPGITGYPYEVQRLAPILVALGLDTLPPTKIPWNHTFVTFATLVLREVQNLTTGAMFGRKTIHPLVPT